MSCFLGDQVKFPEVFTVRLGNTRESLAIVREKPVQDIKEITLNLYSLSLVLGPDRFSEILKDIKSGRYHISVEQAASQYILVKGVPISEAARFFAPYN